MANKTENQVISQKQEYVVLWKILIDFLEGPWSKQLENVSAEIETGDRNFITSVQSSALDGLAAQTGSFYNAARSFMTTIAPTLGELAGSPSPGSNLQADIGFMYDYLVDNSKAVKTRGITKAAWSADGSNTGDGIILQHTTDLEGDEIDVAHPDPSLRLRCIQGGGRGVTVGQEPFELIGSKVDNPSWEDDGIGNVPMYSPQIGFARKGLSSSQLSVRGIGLGTESVRSMSGGSPNNLLTNGGFESAVGTSGNDKFSGITFESGATNAEEETTSPIVGDQSMKVSGNCKFYMTLRQSGVYPRTVYGFGCLLKRVVDTSLTLDLTVKIKDDTTTHQTVTLDETDLAADTVEHEGFGSVVLPAAIGENLRMEVEITNFTPNSSADYLLLDEFITARMYLLDMGQFILPIRGENPWEENDIFTSSVSDAGTGLMQEFMNRVFGNYLKHASSATDFTDPVLDPDAQALNSSGTEVADGGTIALGATDTGEQTVEITFRNDGIYPLAVGVSVEATTPTNASLTSESSVVAVQPGRTETVSVGITPGGAGGYSFEVGFDLNQSDNTRYTITITGTAS